MPSADDCLPARPMLELLLDRPGAGVCLVGPDGRILAANDEWLRATGFAGAEVVGEDVVALFPETRDMALALHARARAGHTVAVPRHAQRVRGRLTWWEGSVAPLQLAEGTGLVLTAREVSSEVNAELERANAALRFEAAERARAEEALRESTALLRAISDASSDVIFAKDRRGRIRFANPATLALIGKPAERVLGRTDAELLDDPAAAAQVMANDRRVMEGGVASDLEEVVPLPDGTPRIWFSRKMPYRDAEGRVIGLLGISRDVTDRKRAEEALRESEERYRSLFANMAEGFALGEVIRDAGGALHDFRFLEMNDAFERQTGLVRADVQGRPMAEVLPHLEPAWLEVYGGVALSGVPRRFESYNRDLDRHFSVFCYRPAPDRFAIVFTDVTDRKRDQAALERANAQLLALDRRKDEFLGVLSHELRNPLAPIRNAVHVLDRAPPDGEQARRARAVIRRQTDHLARLVDDLLDVTRVARGKVELRRERVDLAGVVRRAGEDHLSVVAGRGATLAVEVPPEPVWVEADATRIAQVVGNLLQNASKFTPAGGAVTLSLRAGGATAELAVRDTGVGIEPDLLPLLFQPFVQSESSLSRAHGGLGLGLALVKGIAELHGGSVRAASAGTGRGAEFVVTLPLAPPAAGRAEPAPLAAAARGGRRVLVVDDNRDAADSLAELVGLLGHTVDVAYDGPSAIARAGATAPDVVLCDIGLPGMSGYEVARALRAGGLPRVRLVAVSGYAQPADRARSAEAGFDAHVAKPPDPEEIERLIG